MAAMSGDLFYQEKLRDDFRNPAVELRVWEYAIGKLKDEIEVSASVRMTASFAAERARLQVLDLAALEALYAESKALINRALAAADAGRRGALPPAPAQPDVIDCDSAVRKDTNAIEGSRSAVGDRRVESSGPRED